MCSPLIYHVLTGLIKYNKSFRSCKIDVRNIKEIMYFERKWPILDRQRKHKLIIKYNDPYFRILGFSVGECIVTYYPTKELALQEQDEIKKKQFIASSF